MTAAGKLGGGAFAYARQRSPRSGDKSIYVPVCRALKGKSTQFGMKCGSAVWYSCNGAGGWEAGSFKSGYGTATQEAIKVTTKEARSMSNQPV